MGVFPPFGVVLFVQVWMQQVYSGAHLRPMEEVVLVRFQTGSGAVRFWRECDPT